MASQPPDFQEAPASKASPDPFILMKTCSYCRHKHTSLVLSSEMFAKYPIEPDLSLLKFPQITSTAPDALIKPPSTYDINVCGVHVTAEVRIACPRCRRRCEYSTESEQRMSLEDAKREIEESNLVWKRVWVAKGIWTATQCGLPEA